MTTAFNVKAVYNLNAFDLQWTDNIEWHQKTQTTSFGYNRRIKFEKVLLHYNNMKTASIFIKHILDMFVMYYGIARNIHVYKMLRIRSITIKTNIPFYKMLFDTFYNKLLRFSLR